MISSESLAKFKALYKEHFNEELTDEEALPKAISLLRMMQLIYKPITKEDLDRVIKRREELELDN